MVAKEFWKSAKTQKSAGRRFQKQNLCPHPQQPLLGTQLPPLFLKQNVGKETFSIGSPRAWKMPKVKIPAEIARAKGRARAGPGSPFQEVFISYGFAARENCFFRRNT